MGRNSQTILGIYRSYKIAQIISVEYASMKNVQLLTPADWKDYALLDSGDGEKLEQFGEYRLSRPDPQILWKKSLSEVEWRKSTARFVRSIEDKGNWQTYERMREEWPVRWRDSTLLPRLSPCQYTGRFP